MLQNLAISFSNIGLMVDNITLNNTIQRVPVAGKKGLPGWYVGREINGKIFASYGDWSTGEKHSFKNGENGSAVLSPEETKVMALLAEVSRKERERRQREAARESLAIWDDSEPVPVDHPYLVVKGIKPHEARFEKATGALIINLKDEKGEHASIQRIKDKNQLQAEDEPGKKLFYDGKKKGCCHMIDGTSDKIYICEGFATGATINEVTGCKVLVAIDSGNLLSVAKNAREMFGTWKEPQEIIIAADNDWKKAEEIDEKTGKKKKNSGLIHARKAAEAIGAELIFPERIQGSDFNDMAAELGAEAARQALLKGDSFYCANALEVKQRQFGLVPANELIKDLQPTEYLIRPFLETQCLAVLFAEPASYKSFLALSWALCVATGKEWLGHEVKQGPAVAIIGEGHNGYGRRIAAWGKANNVDLENVPFFVSKVPASITEQQSALHVQRAIEGVSKEHGKPVLVILDTLARNFGPGDENSTADMNKFVAHLDHYIGSDTTRLIVHHTGHGDKSRGRGSSVLKAAVDAEYRLSKTDQIAKLSCEKMKDADMFEPIALSPKVVHLGGPLNDPITSLHLELTEAPKQEVPLSPQMRQALSLLDLMTRKRSRNCLSDWMHLCGEEDVYTKSVFYRAVKTMEDKGVVVISDGYVARS